MNQKRNQNFENTLLKQTLSILFCPEPVHVPFGIKSQHTRIQLLDHLYYPSRLYLIAVFAPLQLISTLYHQGAFCQVPGWLMWQMLMDGVSIGLRRCVTTMRGYLTFLLDYWDVTRSTHCHIPILDCVVNVCMHMSLGDGSCLLHIYFSGGGIAVLYAAPNPFLLNKYV